MIPMQTTDWDIFQELWLFDWKKDINDPVSRNILSKQACEDLLQKVGVNDYTTLVLYGDFNNWFLAFAFWVFKYYGYKDVRLMNGGRKKWLTEDRPLTKDVPQQQQQQNPKGNFKASSEPDKNIRVFLSYVKESLDAKDRVGMVDGEAQRSSPVRLQHHLNILQKCSERRTHTRNANIPGAKQSMIVMVH